MDLNDPYHKGYEAARDHYTGKISYAQSECPYVKGSEDATEWYRGNSDFYQDLDYSG